MSKISIINKTIIVTGAAGFYRQLFMQKTS